MRIHFFLYIGLLASTILGCKSEKYKIGDCLNPVDGSQIYKVSKVAPLTGELYMLTQWSSEPEALPERIYAKVPCPTIQDSSN